MGKWVLIFFVGMNWNPRVGGTNMAPEIIQIRLTGEMRQEFDTEKDCDKALMAVHEAARGDLGLYIRGHARCERLPK